VRISPGEVSFIEPEVWKEVYGHRASTFIKTTEFYGPDPYGNPSGIMRADNVSHAHQRRMISHAFSDKALRDQENLLRGYVGLLVEKLKGIAAGNKQTDIVEWCSYASWMQYGSRC
jgi:cytochrome P450